MKYDYIEIQLVRARPCAPAISPSTFTLDPNGSESREKSALRAPPFSWKDPQLLFGYSKDSIYKDLGIYFDNADQVSVVNRVATRTFRIFGLGGNQAAVDWDQIRGTALVFRMEPSTFINMGGGGSRTSPIPFQPLITQEELVQTVLFFKEHDPRTVALRRDAQRYSMYSVPGPGTPGAPPPPPPPPDASYHGPAGARPWAKVLGSDAAACAVCGRAAALAGGLRRCACRGPAYCGKECQRADWPSHRPECTAAPAHKRP